ncbi:MAG TPA: thioesterase family protein [Candidatus Sulfopaludibacter sp.]|jgi:acyl-CoA thioester hydrolase|nr:thioesterase family protein [Candidatus Sulfopaludibacter sp.]
MKPPQIPLEKIVALEPPCLRMTVPEAYRDSNGHMNVRWYVAIFDDASDVLHDDLGLTVDYHRGHGSGTFDLEHHIQYLSEVMPGEQVAVYVRYVGQSAKRLHYVMFLVNESRGKLAATLECLNAFADLRVRRTAPWPAEAAAKIAARVEGSQRLDWAAPLSGSIQG